MTCIKIPKMVCPYSMELLAHLTFSSIAQIEREMYNGMEIIFSMEQMHKYALILNLLWCNACYRLSKE